MPDPRDPRDPAGKSGIERGKARAKACCSVNIFISPSKSKCCAVYSIIKKLRGISGISGISDLSLLYFSRDQRLGAWLPCSGYRIPLRAGNSGNQVFPPAQTEFVPSSLCQVPFEFEKMSR